MPRRPAPDATAVADSVSVSPWEELDDAVRDQWRRLAVERGNPFIGPEWVEACVDAGASTRPWVLTMTDPRGALTGAMAVEPGGIGPLRSLRLPGSAFADWYEPACVDGFETSFMLCCTQALAQLDQAGAIELHRWSGPIDPLLEGGVAARRTRPDDVLPFIELPSGGWEGYLASRSRNFRSQLRRRRRRLEREHRVAFRLADEDSLTADWRTFERLHEARWSERGGSRALRGSAAAAHAAFARHAAARGWLRLWLMAVDGHDVGAWYGWRLGPRYGYQLSGFDPALEDEGVGTVLLAHTIEQAAAEGARVYDLLWGDEPYKARYETGRRSASSWVLTGPRSLTGVAFAARVAATSVGRRLPPRARRLVPGR